MKKKLKIHIAKAARESLEALPQSDRAAIMKDFMACVQNGTLRKKSKPVDMDKMRREEPELHKQIMAALADIKNL